MRKYLLVKRLLLGCLVLFLPIFSLSTEEKTPYFNDNEQKNIAKNLKILFSNTPSSTIDVHDIYLITRNSRPDTNDSIFFLKIGKEKWPISTKMPVNQRLKDGKEIIISLIAIKENYATLQITDKKNQQLMTLNIPIKEKKGGKDKNFTLLAKSIFLKENLYLAKYHPNNQQVTSKSVRLVVDGKLLIIKENDFLIFKDNTWQQAKGQNTQNLPLAHIIKIDKEKLTISAWNIYGEKITPFAILAPRHSMEKSKDIFFSLHLRGFDSVSCYVEGQRMILSTGNILIKRGKYWELFNDAKILEGKEMVTQPLIVIDKIENGKILKATLFDATLSSMNTIEIPIISTVRGKKKL